MLRNKIEINNEIYDLNYCISKSDDGCFVVSVSKDYNNVVVDKSIIKLVPITFDTVVEIVETMCRNTVTPTCFREIAEELVVNKIIVE